ncbi:Coq4 family protein [Archangium lansingense]|uniref:Coq4 family protein n=1 Tax=Archangium lansingense TaxID=2995310 RepID=A0ABT4A8U3_9BACT|nr:Coq4 family protein [Archangium lansinium]MCY1078072.1 Coq4 family protein [Archangium lansinium]
MSDAQTLSLPDNASLFTRLRVASQCLGVLKEDPTNPTAGQTFNLSLNANVYASLVQQFQRGEEGRRLLSERPSLQGKELDLTAFERMPEGTLGHEFARYYRDNKIFPFETTLELENDIHFISKRYRETHDLLHVLTGYGTDVVGEMELQAYVLGNLGLRTTAFVLLNGTIGLLKTPQSSIGRSEYLQRLWAAFRRGRASPQFLSVRFEDHWETPVATLRARLCAPANG